MRHTLKKATLPLLGLLIATLAGCASSSSKSPSASAATPADVNGTWTGGTATGAATITMILKQTGTNVVGTLTGAGTLDGPIEGTVDGNTIRLRERTGYGSTPLLNVRGNQITGTVGSTTLNLRRTP
jgi:hypothetical protein